MNGELNKQRAFEPVHVGARFTGSADWGVMVRTGGAWKLVCVGCTRSEADELARRLNVSRPQRQAAER